jgi:hypothetical protein
MCRELLFFCEKDHIFLWHWIHKWEWQFTFNFKCSSLDLGVVNPCLHFMCFHFAKKILTMHLTCLLEIPMVNLITCDCHLTRKKMYLNYHFVTQELKLEYVENENFVIWIFLYKNMWNSPNTQIPYRLNTFFPDCEPKFFFNPIIDRHLKFNLQH